MWKNMFFGSGMHKKGTSSLHREIERPSKQVAWSEENFGVTILAYLEEVLLLFKELLCK
jgi:hypothetical protein